MEYEERHKKTNDDRKDERLFIDDYQPKIVEDTFFANNNEFEQIIL